GTGSVKGAITLNSGAVLEPGDNGVGIFTDSSSVVINAGAVVEMEIDKKSFSSDKLRVIGTLTFGGKLIIKSINEQPFSIGDSFSLFEAFTYTGNFSTIEPETPGEGLLWDFSNTTGVLKVVADPSYLFTLPAKNFSVSVSNATCNGSNNGKITISASEAYDYKVVLNSDSKAFNLSSSSPLVISTLKSGNYTACITIPDKPGYEQCYDLIITQPDPLSVYAAVDQNKK